MSGCQKGKKRKRKVGKKVADPLNPLEVISTREGGACHSVGKYSSDACLPFPLHLCDQKLQSVVRAQIPGIWSTGSLLPILALTSCVRLLQKRAQLPSTRLGWRMCSCYCAKS